MKDLIICLTILSLSISTVSGAYGTEAFSFLSMNVGARSSAMGKASAAAVGDIEGVYNNPASIASIKDDCTLAGAYDPIVFADSYAPSLAGFWNAALTLRVLPFMTVGASAFGLSYGDIIGNIIDANSAGSTIAAGDIGASASAALSMKNIFGTPLSLDIGAAARFVRETLDTSSISCLAANAGAVLVLEKIIPASDIALGLYVKDIGIAFGDISAAVPTAFIGGVSYSLKPVEWLRITAAGDVSYSASKIAIAAGGELGLFGIVALRGGYLHDDGVGVITAGAGIRYTLSQFTFILDYAATVLGDFGMRHAVQAGIGMRFSPSVSAASPSTVPSSTPPNIPSSTTRTPTPENTDSDYEAMTRGIAHAREKRYADAIAEWEKVPEGSEYYEKARMNIERAKAKLAE